MDTKGSSPIRMTGLFLVLCGLGGAVFFYGFFDTSVAIPETTILNTTIGGGRVNNLGLMQDRQNGILFGFGSAILGGVLMFVGRDRTRTLAADERKCPFCAEYVKVEAIVCRYCHKELPSSKSEVWSESNTKSPPVAPPKPLLSPRILKLTLVLTAVLVVAFSAISVVGFMVTHCDWRAVTCVW